MTEPIQYDFEFVVRAKSPWIASFAKAMAAFFYSMAVFGAVAWHVLAGLCLLVPDWTVSRDFLAGYQPAMISITQLGVMAIASSLVSGLFRNKDRMRIRALRSDDETEPATGAPERGRPRPCAGTESLDT